jgi:hypothetical protein
VRVHPGSEKSFVVTFEEPGVRMVWSVFKALRDLEAGYPAQRVREQQAATRKG